MSAAHLPGFAGEASLYKTSGRYQSEATRSYGSRRDAVIPALLSCRACDRILDRCEKNGWRPSTICDACLNCYDAPPPPLCPVGCLATGNPYWPCYCGIIFPSR